MSPPMAQNLEKRGELMDDLFTMFKSMKFERDRETGSRFMKSCESRLDTVYYPYQKRFIFI